MCLLFILVIKSYYNFLLTGWTGQSFSQKVCKVIVVSIRWWFFLLYLWRFFWYLWYLWIYLQYTLLNNQYSDFIYSTICIIEMFCGCLLGTDILILRCTSANAQRAPPWATPMVGSPRSITLETVFFFSRSVKNGLYLVQNCA